MRYCWKYLLILPQRAQRYDMLWFAFSVCRAFNFSFWIVAIFFLPRPYQCSYFKYFSMHINIHMREKRIIIKLLYNFIISYANGVTFFSSISHNFDSFLNLIQKKRWTNDNIGTIYIYLHCVFVVKWHLVLLKPKQKHEKKISTHGWKDKE